MSEPSDDNIVGGCGCLVLILIAAVIHFQVDVGQFLNGVGNIIKGILAIGGVVLVLCLFGLLLPEEPKGKRKGKPKNEYGRDQVIHTDKPAKSISRRQESRVTRLEVPGGYVPFEMTKTETKTKDTLKRETTIKTYVDSREVTAILKDKDVNLLRDGRG